MKNGEPLVELDNDFSFENFIDPFSTNKITDSKEFIDGEWKQKTRLKNFEKGVNKYVLPVDISEFKIMVLTEVSAGQIVKSHAHKDEPVFRYIVSGSLTLNGIRYKVGDWVMVPTGIPYEITTDIGYTTMAPYCMSCEQNG